MYLKQTSLKADMSSEVLFQINGLKNLSKIMKIKKIEGIFLAFCNSQLVEADFSHKNQIKYTERV